MRNTFIRFARDFTKLAEYFGPDDYDKIKNPNETKINYNNNEGNNNKNQTNINILNQITGNIKDSENPTKKLSKK